MSWIVIDGIVFVCALALGLAFTALCGRLAWKLGFLDTPKSEQHKQHRRPTPLLGGVAMFAAWFVTMSAAFAVYVFLRENSLDPEVSGTLGGMPLVSNELIAMTACAAASVLLGLYDDKHALKAWQKLIGQILIASAATLFAGVKITLFVPNPVFSFCATVFWFILIFNAVNFFDNMDGLAAGTAVIAFLFFTVASAANGQFFMAALGASCAGAAAGFWWFNKYPAKIFMGDSGSHFLAFMLAFISARITYYTPGISATRFALLIPLFILAIPLLDAVTVVIIRLRNHKPIYVGDHNHISHRFRNMGLSTPAAVGMVHLLSAIAGLGALPLLWGELSTCVLLIVQGLAIYGFVCFLQYSLPGGNFK